MQPLKKAVLFKTGKCEFSLLRRGLLQRHKQGLQYVKNCGVFRAGIRYNAMDRDTLLSCLQFQFQQGLASFRVALVCCLLKPI